MKSAVAWFARNSVAANLLMWVIVAAGLLSLPRLKQEIFPEIRADVVTATVSYRGASPEEVEEAICVRIEERIQGVEGIKRLRCVATEGVGVVTAEIHSWADTDRALDEIKTEVDAIDTFPAETEKPIVKQATMRSQVINVALYGAADEKTLRHLGQTVRDEIVELPGITHAELVNARPYEISIEVSEHALRRHGLTFDQVVEAVRQSSLDLPAGSLKTEGGEIVLRTKGQAYRGHEFEQLVLLSRSDGTRVPLGEVARVVDGFEETDRWARFDGQPSVMVQVFRVGDQGALDVAEKVRGYVAVKQSRLPAGISITTWQDMSLLLRARLDTLLVNARAGFVLILVVLALFLRLRLAFWVGLGVPIAVLGTVALLPWLDVSINLLSLFAFLVVLGILVDDAIVVGENIHTHQERGEDPLESAITGAQEVSVPVLFGVLTTVAAFGPLLFIPGAMGKITVQIPLVVITALAFSTIESKLILPAHLAHSRARGERSGDRGFHPWKRLQGAVASGLSRFLRSVYGPLVERAIAWRYTTAAVGVSVLLLAFGIVAGGWVRFVFFPSIEGDNVVAFLTLPQGTPAEVTERAIRQLEESAEQVRAELDTAADPDAPSVYQHVLASVGEQPYRARQERDRRGPQASSVAAPHEGEVNVELAPSEKRTVTSVEIAKRWRELTGPIPDAVELSFTSSLFSAGEPVNVELRGTDVARLRSASEDLREQLGAYAGVFDVTDSFRGGKQELKLAIKPSAEALGLKLSDLARQVRQAFYGDEAQRIQRGRDDVRVMVRYPAAERRSVADVEDMRIRAADGTPVPFSAVAEVELGRGFATIQRADRKRIIAVTADVDQSVVSPNDVVGSLRTDVLPAIVADHPGVDYTLQGEQGEQSDFLAFLLRGFGVALLVIFALLAIPLGSYVQPLLIMSAIPFGMVGGILGHLLMGWDLSMFSVIGLVAVSGVVVNDSLVLVDYVNRQRATGRPLAEVVREAGQARFRPILLTSLTTFVGLLPLLLERSVQAQFLIPMAISLAFGVLFSTGVTLILLPASYLILEDVGRVLRQRLGSSRDAPASPTARPAT